MTLAADVDDDLVIARPEHLTRLSQGFRCLHLHIGQSATIALPCIDGVVVKAHGP
jgi:hypothetical protein